VFFFVVANGSGIYIPLLENEILFYLESFKIVEALLREEIVNNHLNH